MLNNTILLVFEHNSYVSGLAAELFFYRSGALAPDRGQGRPGSAGASMFFPAMPGPKMGQQSTLMVSGQHTFLQNGLLQWSITDGVLALQQIPPPGLEPGSLG